MKTKPTIIYHIFSNERDEWLTNYKEAVRLFNEWRKGYGCARLYKEIWDPEELERGGMPSSEDCIKTYGDWPL